MKVMTGLMLVGFPQDNTRACVIVALEFDTRAIEKLKYLTRLIFRWLYAGFREFGF